MTKSMTDLRLLRYDHIIIHCTATTPDMHEVDAEWVHQAHLARGWRGNGYHFVIKMTGELESHDTGESCRPLGQQGAHVGDCGPGWNGRCLGVALVGGLDKMGRPSYLHYTESQYTTLRKLLLRLQEEHPHPSALTVLGHRDLIRQTKARPKACPCFDVQDWLLTQGLARLEDEDTPGWASSPMDIPLEHVIQRGDTVWAIGRRYGIPISEITRLNPTMPRPHKIVPGFRIRLR